MARFRLLIAYNGYFYRGWQKQKKEVPTIQGEVEKALFQIFRQPIRLTGAGRTDAGVHALAQTAHFDWDRSLPCQLSLKKALNSILPSSICIQTVWKAPKCFHALCSATSKSYIYVIGNHGLRSVFWTKQVYHYPYPLDEEILSKMSQLIQGRHDFKSFQNMGTPVSHSVRTVYQSQWLKKKNFFIFYIRGEGFLKQMIRNLVGTQLDLFRKHSGQKMAIKEFQKILSAKDRKMAGQTAPSNGLYLYRVSYPKKLDRECQLL